MVRISDVWDRTVDVLRGRAAILAGIAFLTMVLPAIAVGAVGNVVSVPTGASLLGSLIQLVVVALLVTGVLAMTAVASDPLVDRAQGFRIARQRLLPALGVSVALAIALLVVAVPIALFFVYSGAHLSAQGTVDMSQAAPGASVGIGLATIAGGVLAIWVTARIVPLFAVIVNERRGVGALRRSLALTRGATLRLIGVLILYFIVLAVVMLAVSSVVGVVARLVLGAEAVGTVRFVLAVVSGLISAGATVVQTVFNARFYVAAVEREQRMAPLA
ncbi:hypothetical protein J2Y58_002754 [Sphingomonas sp. BE138]|uniref:hypothetical protein n=1 Tax=Sphingomonas sp. BE138 TaxID=2817845 RepID=UPI0028647F4B|nr:hypothetical protein [Sphingomonas sp. BE138]MDR6789383.1 hypothetical protein [Sphingomonas sp. BE138]